MHTLIDEKAIAERIAILGKAITEFYRGEELTVVALLHGSVIFSADLLRKIELPLWFDSLCLASYIDRASTGRFEVRSRLKLPISGRHALLIDDILDSGRTLAHASEYLRAAGAVSVRSCVLLDKKVERAPGGIVKPDWHGFEIENVFVAGYGLDHSEFLRNLPSIVAV